MSAKPPSADPGHAAFWDKRYAEGVTPWDLGHVPPRLLAYLDANHGRGATVFVPGCGTGYEVAALSESGYVPDAVDISPQAVAIAQATMKAHAHFIRLGDFFSESTVANTLYERAFLCALPRRMWPQYAQAINQRVLSGGRVFGFFYVGAEAGGPPFAISEERLLQMFYRFECVEDERVDDMPAFGGKLRWMVWQHQPTGEAALA